MPLPLIAAALGAARAGIGLLQNRSNVRNQRNRINDAYTFGHQRQNIMQQDVRGSEAEGIASRGLAQGGDIQIGGALSPTSDPATLGVGGAHTLGGQQQADLHREQQLEQNDLLRQRDNAVSDVEAEGKQGAVSSIASGIATGFQVAGIQGAAGNPPSTDPANASSPGGIASAYSAAGVNPHFNGIDPINPLQHNDWGGGELAHPGQSNASFTTYGVN